MKPRVYEMDQITLSVPGPSEEAMPWLLLLHHIRTCSANKFRPTCMEQAISKRVQGLYIHVAFPHVIHVCLVTAMFNLDAVY